jgi:Fe2+ or Zn2+ uptake regulation protein
MLSVEELKARFAERGLRVTPQRELLFRLLEETQGNHPTAEALHVRATRAMPSISLRTVYAILDELADVGVLRPLDLGTGSRRFCTNRTAHHHLVCERCGRVSDVYVDLPKVNIPAEQSGSFQITDQTMIFRGYCGSCRDSQVR